MIITRTPIRLSFLGGGTDFPAWYNRHGGMVVGGCLDKYSYVQARRLLPFHAHKTRVVYSEVETVNDNDDIQHAAVRATLKHLGFGGGVEIFHAGDIPGRSGTGSSSTFVVGLLNAVAALQGRFLSRAELADAAIHVEQNLLGETVGCQDQTWAAHGGLNVIKFRQNGDISVFPLCLDRAGIESLEAHLMLFFSGQSRTSSDVARACAQAAPQKEKEHWTLLRLAEEGVSAIQKGDHESLGRLMDQGWRIKAGLAPGVSTETVSRLYNTARVCGAWGGKVMGAGGGGCVALVVPPGKQGAVAAGLKPLGATHIPFRFDFDGSVVIFSDHRAGRQ